MAPSRNFLSLLVVILIFSQWKPNRAFPQEAIQIMEGKEALVARLADEAAALFRRRGKFVSRCDCSVHICRASFDQNPCSLVRRQLVALCGGEECLKEKSEPVSFVQTPPDVDIDAVSNEMQENVCLYKRMEGSMKKLDPKPRSATRVSTKDGQSRVYPGAKLRSKLFANGKGGKESYCSSFDPRRVADYVGASVGPKDVVFVVDSSADMAKQWSARRNVSRLEVVSEAMPSLLDTLSAMDRVNLVAYSDEARRRGVGQGLFSATAFNLQLLKSSIGSLYPRGQSNLRAGMKLGFELLIQSNEKRRRRGSFNQGQKVIVVITGSPNQRDKRGRAVRHSKFLREVARLQGRLEKVSGLQATIFTYSIGLDVDTALLKQVACANRGAWFTIGPKDDAFRLLHMYHTFLASTHAASYPVWTNFKRDPYGAGSVATVAKAFHFLAGNRQDAFLLGVVSHDVRLEDLQVANLTAVEIEKELMQRSRRHDAVEGNVCQLQVYRNVYANGAICVDPLPTGSASSRPVEKSKKKRRTKSKKSRRTKSKEKETPPCFRRGGMYYKLFSSPKSWEDAAASCQKEGGELVQVSSADELAFLAGMASPDGSWIGARGYSKGRRFRWTESKGLATVLSEIDTSRSSFNESCVRLDNRGPVENLAAAPCAQELSHICSYKGRKSCPRVIPLPNRGYFLTPPLDTCIQEEEALANAGAVSSASLLPSSHLWCSLENGSRDLRSICCRPCKKRRKVEALPSKDAEDKQKRP